MIGLDNVLKIFLQDVLKMSWRRLQKVLTTSWRCLQDFFARRLEEVFKKVLKTSWQVVLKTSWRHLENVVLKTYGQDEYIGLDQDFLKTSSENVWLRRIYPPWSRCLEDVFWRRRRKTSSIHLHQDKYLLGNYCCCLDLYHITFYIMLYSENAKYLQIDWLKQCAYLSIYIFTIST